MLDLLEAGSWGRREAAAALQADRARRGGAQACLARLLPQDLGLGLAGPLAWWEAARHTVRLGPVGLVATHRLEGLLRALESADGSKQETLLGAALAHSRLGYGLDLEPFRAAHSALIRELGRGGFASQAELLDHAQAVSAPAGRTLLQVFGLSSERRVVLADAALGAAELLGWWEDPRASLARGKLFIPAADLAAHGLGPADLHPEGPLERLDALLAGCHALAERELAKAWAITGDLGRLRGRVAAVWLRQQWTRLCALRLAGTDILQSPRKAPSVGLSLGSSLGLILAGPPRRLPPWPPPFKAQARA